MAIKTGTVGVIRMQVQQRVGFVDRGKISLTRTQVNYQQASISVETQILMDPEKRFVK